MKRPPLQEAVKTFFYWGLTYARFGILMIFF